MNDNSSLSGVTLSVMAWVALLVLVLIYRDCQQGNTLDGLIDQRCADQTYYDQLPETVERPVLTLECE